MLRKNFKCDYCSDIQLYFIVCILLMFLKFAHSPN